MTNKLSALILFSALCSSSVCAQLEDGWRGIKVFRSDRSHVEKILGRPVEMRGAYSRYETDDAWVRVTYASGPCTDVNTFSGEYRVKEGIVLRYLVTPKPPILLSALSRTNDRYVRTEDQHAIGWVYYEDKEDNIRLEANAGEAPQEKVYVITFDRPPSLEKQLHCAPKN